MPGGFSGFSMKLRMRPESSASMQPNELASLRGTRMPATVAPAPLSMWYSIKDAVINGVILGFQDASLALWLGFPHASLSPMANSYLAPLWTLSIEFYGSILVLLLARSRSWIAHHFATIILGRTYLLCFLVGHVAARFDLGGKRLLVSWPMAAAAATSARRVPHQPLHEPEAGGAFLRAAGAVSSPLPVGKGGLLDKGLRGEPVHRWNHAMRADPDIPRSQAAERPGPIVVPDLPDPLAHHFWRRDFLAGGVGALGRRATGADYGVAHQYCCDLAAALCFEPVDQIALRVSRAWRKREAFVICYRCESASGGLGRTARATSVRERC